MPMDELDILSQVTPGPDAPNPAPFAPVRPAWMESSDRGPAPRRPAWMRDNARSSLLSVGDTDPDHVARADRLGLPADLAPEELDRHEREASIAAAPITTRQWLSNPANARYAHDSVQELSTIENLLRG